MRAMQTGRGGAEGLVCVANAVYADSYIQSTGAYHAGERANPAGHNDISDSDEFASGMATKNGPASRAPKVAFYGSKTVG